MDYDRHKGIESSIVQHRIHLNEEATPKEDPQRRLNPIMQEDVHAEIMTLRQWDNISHF